jgi:hypothetical protein
MSKSLDSDPTADSLLNGELANLKGVKFKDARDKKREAHDWVLDCRLGEVLYTEYRCFWLHEGRPGEATHSFNLRDDAPSYLDNQCCTPPRIEFSIPFLCEVLGNCIESFKQGVEQDGIDPVPPSHMKAINLDLDDA